MAKPGIHAYIDIQLKDKNGKVLKKLRFKSKSWVKNMAILLSGALSNTSFTLVDQSGNNANVPNNTDVVSVFKTNAPAGEDRYGILVGSGTNPVSPNDYKLYNKIPNSILAHSDTNVGQFTGNENGFTFAINRTFTNNGTQDVTVSEVGLAILAASLWILIARDLLSSPITVQPGQVLQVTYAISLLP